MHMREIFVPILMFYSVMIFKMQFLMFSGVFVLPSVLKLKEQGPLVYTRYIKPSTIKKWENHKLPPLNLDTKTCGSVQYIIKQ